MTDRIDEIERRLEKLEETVRAAERRLAELSFGSSAAEAAEPEPRTAPGESSTRDSIGLVGALSLVGRTCLVLGGAFLIRAATEAGMLSRFAGPAAGLVYAGFWLLLADRQGHLRRTASATFHGVTAVLIAYPLLWEAAKRFGVLTPTAAVVAVALATELFLFVARRQPVQALCWAVTLGALATLLGLLASTPAIEPAAGALILLAGSTMWIAYGRRWHGPRWPAALGADGGVLLMTSLATRAGGPPGISRGLPLPGAFLLAIALPVVCLSSFAVQTLVRRREVSPFEYVQSAAALFVGFGGAISVARTAGFGVVGLGVAILTLGFVSYGVAFAFVEGRAGLTRNFHYYASLGLLTTLGGGALWLTPSGLALMGSAIAVAAAILSGRFGRQTLRWHCAVFIVAAAVVSGLASACFDAFTAPAGETWRRLGATGTWVWLAAAASYIAFAIRPPPEGKWRARLPAFAVAVVAVSGMAAASVRPLAILSENFFGQGVAVIAAVRTAVLAASAVLLAAAGRQKGLSELSWLVYPVLGIGGLKLLLEDFPHGRPLTLFIAFALYGGALLLAPRLLRRSPGR